MTDHYLYPALFEPGEQSGFVVSFPDLPGCLTEGDTLEEAVHMAKDALALHLFGMESDGDLIPPPTAPQAIHIPEGGFISLVEAWMPPIRDDMLNRSVKKTLTIPKWLNDIAEQEKINFSQLLQTALKAKLGAGTVNAAFTAPGGTSSAKGDTKRGQAL